MFRLMSIASAFLATAALGFSELPDSTGRMLDLDSLARKVDSLESSLVKLRLDLQDRSPYAISDSPDWGKGMGIGLRYNVFGIEPELRYTFSRKQVDTGSYFANTRRIGLAAGFKMVAEVKERDVARWQPAEATMAGFGGIRLSTPVLHNFTSFSFGADLFWSDPAKSWVPGYSQSLELQFWTTKIGHLDLGFATNIDFRKEERMAGFEWFRPYFGTTFSTQAFGRRALIKEK